MQLNKTLNHFAQLLHVLLDPSDEWRDSRENAGRARLASGWRVEAGDSDLQVLTESRLDHKGRAFVASTESDLTDSARTDVRRVDHAGMSHRANHVRHCGNVDVAEVVGVA